MKKLEMETCLIGLKEVELLMDIACDALLPDLVGTYDKEVVEQLEIALYLIRERFKEKRQTLTSLFYEE